MIFRESRPTCSSSIVQLSCSLSFDDAKNNAAVASAVSNNNNNIDLDINNSEIYTELLIIKVVLRSYLSVAEA